MAFKLSSSPVADRGVQLDLEQIESEINAIEAVTSIAVIKTLVDAKGDLLVGTADNTLARQAVGSNNQVLTADSTQTDGLKWATPTVPIAQGKHFPVLGGISQPATAGCGAGVSMYWGKVFIPVTTTLTGFAYTVAVQSGNVRVALYDSTGARVANRTTNSAVPVGGAVHAVTFDSTYSAAPGYYFIGWVPSSNTLSTYYQFLCADGGVTTVVGGVTATSITPPTGAPTSAQQMPTGLVY